MKRLLAVIQVIVATGALAAAEGEGQAVDVTLEAGKAHEACVRLAAGEKRQYHWKSSAPVDFNVHYHEGPEVFYPVKREGMRGDGGSVTAKTAQEYCWMWTARAPKTRVQGAIK